jgi:hypothetical protein
MKEETKSEKTMCIHTHIQATQLAFFVLPAFLFHYPVLKIAYQIKKEEGREGGREGVEEEKKEKKKRK